MATRSLEKHSLREVRVEKAERSEPTLSVVIPAKNEARNLPYVLEAMDESIHEVILVDGNSTDDTVEVARRLRPGITIVGQTRKGKGNALACGLAAATGDFVVMLDADGSTDPAEIPRFIEALKNGADFATGSRFLPGGGSNDITRLRRIGSYWLGKAVNLLYGMKYTDPNYGFNALRRDCMDVLDLNSGAFDGGDPSVMLWGDGFEVETLMHVRIAKAGLRVVEVPCFERSRVYGASNLHAFSDGLRVLRTIHAERRRGTQKSDVIGRPEARQPGESWALVSTLSEEAS